MPGSLRPPRGAPRRGTAPQDDQETTTPPRQRLRSARRPHRDRSGWRLEACSLKEPSPLNKRTVYGAATPNRLPMVGSGSLDEQPSGEQVGFTPWASAGKWRRVVTTLLWAASVRLPAPVAAPVRLRCSGGWPGSGVPRAKRLQPGAGPDPRFDPWRGARAGTGQARGRTFPGRPSGDPQVDHGKAEPAAVSVSIPQATAPGR